MSSHNSHQQQRPTNRTSSYNHPFTPTPLPASSKESLREPHRVLFAGLPNDITASDLRDLLLSDLHLSPLTTSVTSLHDGSGEFQGVMLVYVGSSEDAEKIRAQYSGQNLDGTYVLQVHHVLPSYVSLPFQSNFQQLAVQTETNGREPRGFKDQIEPRSRAPQQPKHQAQGLVGNRAASNSKAKGIEKAPGLALLKRIEGGPGNGKGQINTKKQKPVSKINKSSGASLMARMGPSPAGAASKNKPKSSNGDTKTKRAKGRLSING
ncbi:uncharacterized protein L203_106101 [Cryptococcus depauperatus CBS 7841]|uniref:Uncharacterized protein n=1 Tax=Cryptococcus depauperatus CBS 7841 TaxID=1295531 RepID=A0A1E3IXW0_9TREE|nr:hypothetical protein L203_00808 [Cryptococcus depauperatus CBS 7841]